VGVAWRHVDIVNRHFLEENHGKALENGDLGCTGCASFAADDRGEREVEQTTSSASAVQPVPQQLHPAGGRRRLLQVVRSCS